MKTKLRHQGNTCFCNHPFYMGLATLIDSNRSFWKIWWQSRVSHQEVWLLMGVTGWKMWGCIDHRLARRGYDSYIYIHIFNMMPRYKSNIIKYHQISSNGFLHNFTLLKHEINNWGGFYQRTIQDSPHWPGTGPDVFTCRNTFPQPPRCHRYACR